MAQLVSPGINVQEFDFTVVVPNVSTTFGAFAGVMRWGPVGERVLIDSEGLLAARFGAPTNLNAESWFTVASYLAYGAPCWVVRAANTTSTNGSLGVLTAIANVAPVSNVLAQMVTTEAQYPQKDGTFDTGVLWIARWPGALGNSLRVSACYSSNNWSQTLNLQSFAAGATFAVNVNSNTATVTIAANSITSANAAAETFITDVVVTDLISVGNAAIGTQLMKVSAITYNPNTDATGNTTTGTAIVHLAFEEPLILHTAYSNTTGLTRFWEFSRETGTAPGQSNWVQNNGNTSANDEMHVVVVDDGGKFTGVPGTVLETFKFVSRASDAKGLDGTSIYYKTVINQQSQYVWWTNDYTSAVSNTSNNVVSSTAAAPLSITMNSGSDGPDEVGVSIGDIARGYDLFQSKEDVQVDLVMAGKSIGAYSGQVANYLLDNIATTRKDCVVFCSPQKSDVVYNKGLELTSVLATRNNLRDTSYGFLDSGYKYMYDKYNDVYRWIPLNGDCAGLTARTDLTNDPWWSPAGFNRGNIKNIIQLAYSPRQADRDVLYPSDVNPVIAVNGAGILLFGDRTLLSIESAFSRINVRRLFIVLERAISLMARAFLFEFNDSFTRAAFKNAVIPYLRDIQARRGITGFNVVCDETNNTPEIINTNQFVGDILVVPNRSINFINLRFVAVNAGVSFTEVEQAFTGTPVQ